MSWLFPAIALAFLPKEGVVPNAETAVKIAEAVAVPVYGNRAIKKENPLTASLREGVWIVSGTLKPDSDGGTVEVRIKRSDGQILELTHGK